ncbi:pteridine reductase [Thiohalorhabdus methylotrophus]|uniref:Pteridine reductase n=1 Tax=Thiohalorhabdus methylotrophus TaxID=3242694 RepID=A0ABV4TQY9_9GAMM
MADGDLAGHVALVTGAAHRLGRATARHLHAAGADVAIHYHSSRAAAEALAEELEAQGPGRARVFGCALEETANLGPLVEAVVAAFGGLDILVNNAARFYPTPLKEASEPAWDELLDTNLKAPFFLAQAAQEHLEARGGAIINLADVHAERPLEHHPVYSVSKAGVVMLTRALAKEMGPRVRVNAVAPGAALWPDAGKSESDKEALLRHTALGRAGGEEPVAEAVHYLARADYVTGQVLSVDGGRLLY